MTTPWKAIRALGFLSVFVLSIWAGQLLATLAAPGPMEEAAAPSASTTQAQVDTAVTVREYSLVYVGSSRCGPSNIAELAPAVQEILAVLRQRAQSESVALTTIGVARESDARAGLAHLEKTAMFDEVAAGQGRLNQAALRFVTRDHPGIAATPQLILVERRFRRQGAGVYPETLEEVVLLRRVGVHEILNWRELGAPAPHSRLGSEEMRLMTTESTHEG
jgi:hypothetical protein